MRKNCIRIARNFSLCAGVLMAAGLSMFAGTAAAQAPVKSCDSAGIGAVTLAAEGARLVITAVSTGTAAIPRK
jgi:hypothetical protein